MATKNINTFNQSDFEELAAKFNYYALTNLGQRLGVQESSITTNKFKIGDFFNLENKENYCIQVDYNRDNDKITFIPVNILTKESQSPIVISIRETQEISEKIELLQVINDVKFYTNGFIGYNKKTENFYFAFECFYNNTSINNTERFNNENFIQFILEEYDHNTNELLSSIKICKNLFLRENNGTYTNVPSLSYLYKDNDQYKLKFLEIDISNNDVNLFDEIINNIESGLKNSENVSLSNIYNEYIASFITDNGKIKVINNNLSGDDLELNYNTEENVYFEITDYDTIVFTVKDDWYNTHELIIRNNNINHFLYLYSEEISYLYTYLKKYYAKTFYLESNNSLKLKILCYLIKEISNSITFQEEIWLPIDYEVSYFCKTDDLTHIFESANDLFVEYSDSEIELSELKYITVKDNMEKRVSMYKFNILYEDSDIEDNLIYDIVITYDYTFPYINSKKYWVINNKQSDIYAEGRDAGQPNFIYIYNKLEENPNEKAYNELTGEYEITNISKLLYCANKSSVFYVDDFTNEYNDLSDNTSTSNIYWKPVEFKYKCITSLDNEYIENEANKSQYNYNSSFYTLKTAVIDYDKYDDEKKRELLNSVIVNITSVGNVIKNPPETSFKIDNLHDIYGEDGYITTFWILSKNEDDKYEYICLNDPKNPEFPLDLSIMTSINNLILWHLNKYESVSPDNYLYDQLILNCSYITNKNQTVDDTTLLDKKIYASIRGIETTHRYHNNIISSSSNIYQDNYNNSTNLVVDFVDTIINNKKDKRLVETVLKDLGDNYENKNAWFNYSYTGHLITNYLNTYDFLPNTNLPSLELKEILLRNDNLLNRTNFIILDNKKPYYYYSYTGSPYNKDDKKTFVIGTGGNEIVIKDENDNILGYKSINSSFGTDNMSASNNFFGQQENIEINFPNNTHINSKYTYVNNLSLNNIKFKDSSLDDSYMYYINGSNLVVEGYITRNNIYLSEYRKTNKYTRYLFDIKNFVLEKFRININLNEDDLDNIILNDKILLRYVKLSGKYFTPIKYKIFVTEESGHITVNFVEETKKWLPLTNEINKEL